MIALPEGDKLPTNWRGQGHLQYLFKLWAVGHSDNISETMKET